MTQNLPPPPQVVAVDKGAVVQCLTLSVDAHVAGDGFRVREDDDDDQDNNVDDKDDDAKVNDNDYVSNVFLINYITTLKCGN